MWTAQAFALPWSEHGAMVPPHPLGLGKPRSAILLLGSCEDVTPPPSTSSRQLARSVASMSTSALNTITLLFDDQHCPGRCSELNPLLNGSSCLSATELLAHRLINLTAFQEQSAAAGAAAAAAAWPFVWQAMMPAVISSPTFQQSGFSYVWAVELDVFCGGNWAELFGVIPPHDPTPHAGCAVGLRAHCIISNSACSPASVAFTWR